ncbi:MAG TPA: hypothetical protein VFE19_04055 [Jatrophihabitantaceae bacterium]|nr:hypothetical protein [Jatrophihabitantaceae bacterium]
MHRTQHTPAKTRKPAPAPKPQPKPQPAPNPTPQPAPQPSPQPTPRAIELPQVGGLNSDAALVILGVVGAITLAAMGYIVSIGRRHDS